MIDSDALVIEPLAKRHDRAAFSCGLPELDRYLARQAGQDVRRRIARVFVCTADEADTVLGFYTLSALSINLASLPEQLSRKLPRLPVPCALIGRLAVDRSAHGRGLGRAPRRCGQADRGRRRDRGHARPDRGCRKRRRETFLREIRLYPAHRRPDAPVPSSRPCRPARPEGIGTTHQEPPAHSATGYSRAWESRPCGINQRCLAVPRGGRLFRASVAELLTPVRAWFDNSIHCRRSFCQLRDSAVLKSFVCPLAPCRPSSNA